MTRLAAARRLRRDRRGATLVEFAFVAPVLLVMLMGLFDLTYAMYAQGILEGAVQKAGRDGAIEGGGDNTTAIDAVVIGMVGRLVHSPAKSCAAKPAAPSWCSSRKSYASFTAAKPEPFTDTNSNKSRDAGECFDDINGNNRWDADPGRTGQGGASDVALYTFSVTYERLFPVAGLIGLDPDNTITARTLLKNQPFARQATTTVRTICT